MDDTSSIGEQLLAARAKLQAYHEETVEIFDGLWGRYRPLEFRELREIVRGHEKVRNETEQELLIAADTLIAASVGTEARVNGTVKELPKLGMALNQAIGLEAHENDRQAVFELFPTERMLMEQFAKIGEMEGAANAKVDRQLEGESEAASQ